MFRLLLERESLAPPWRELVRVYRRLEARGEIRGGRFVDGPTGEQYALPEAVGLVRAVRKDGPRGELVAVSGADPLNLVGVIVPGDPVAGHAANRVLYRDGVPVAVLEGKGEAARRAGVRVLSDATTEETRDFEAALVRRRPSPLVRAYLGKSRYRITSYNVCYTKLLRVRVDQRIAVGVFVEPAIGVVIVVGNEIQHIA